MNHPNHHIKKKKDHAKFVAAMLKLIGQFKELFPEECTLFSYPASPKTEDLLNCLILFFTEEKQDSSVIQSCFSMDPHQNRIKDFAVQIAPLLISFHDYLMEYTEYTTLLGRKYIAYGFLRRWNQNPGLSQSLLIDPQTHGILYQGLLNFYADFYGLSSDHEEAIRLLCSCFPPTIPPKMDRTQTASVLYLHISTAGTPDDSGYAYQGISFIEQYIKYLPVEIVMKLLHQYPLYEIIHNHVLRHQIFTIIEYSSIKKSLKAQIKFQYLDAVLLMDCLCRPLFDNFKKEYPNISICYSKNILRPGGSRITISQKPYTYWDRTDNLLLSDGMEIIQLTRQTDSCIQATFKNERHRPFPIDYEDWLLESLFSRETEQLIQELINDKPPAFADKQMLFSLLHLEHYRGIRQKTLHFDHKFMYDKNSGVFRNNSSYAYPVPHFYGKAVYSLSCIVGKNGTGKTSIIDFLRESFFKLLKLIHDGLIMCNNGRVTETDYTDYHILDGKTRFTVIFYLGETPYFITNMEESIKDASPFRTSTFGSINECSKIAYFSNMLRMDQSDLFFEKPQNPGAASLSQSLSRFKQADYSETACFIKKRKSIEMFQSETAHKIVNRELCYQFTFLRYMKSMNIQECLDVNPNSPFYVKSPLGQADGNEFFLKDLDNPGDHKIENLEKKYIHFPDAQIHYLSSGQYSKFSFLSRLYWFVSGYETEIEHYNRLLGTNECQNKGRKHDDHPSKISEFRSEEALLENETALIFIDEGELYYHPEWQRRYMQTLLEIANGRKDKSKVQIILTTNSPFLISDILKEDIIYLENGKKEPVFDYTLGQNIHTLLKENFFMDYTIGEYSRRLINRILNALNQKRARYEDDIEELKSIYFGKSEENDTVLNILISQIGEPVYRNNLERLLEKIPQAESQKQISILQTQIKQLTQKVNTLKKKEQN